MQSREIVLIGIGEIGGAYPIRRINMRCIRNAAARPERALEQMVRYDLTLPTIHQIAAQMSAIA